MTLTAKRAKELLEYNPDTGTLTWKVYRNSHVKAGQIAGSLNSQGYLVIGIEKKVYQAHRLIWLIVTGNWPSGQIDHINHLRMDNRWVNLREITQQENQMNKSKFSNNTSGHTGVYQNQSGNWIARIYSYGKHHNLGTFSSIEDAVKAREEAKVNFKFHDNHGK